MPGTKAKPKKLKRPARPARKPASPVAKRAGKAAKPSVVRTQTAVDPRVVAAIALALQDEDVASVREGELREPLSPWTALGRVRTLGKVR